jgi:hypothetical protein
MRNRSVIPARKSEPGQEGAHLNLTVHGSYAACVPAPAVALMRIIMHHPAGRIEQLAP